MKKLRILLTGGNGFIGKNILEKLSQKYSIVSPPINELNLLNIDQTDNFLKNRGFFDIVLHAASIGGKRNRKDSASVIYANTSMFFNLTKNKNSFGRLINFGSGAEYGKDRPLVKVKEDEFGKRIPKDYYGFSKFIIASYLESHKIGTNLRLFGVYGKYEDIGIRFISNVIYQVILKETIVINKNVYFDYLYVDDLVKIIDHFIQKKSKFISYNVGCGRAVSLLTIAKKIVRILKSNSKITLKTKSLDNEYSCNNERLISELGVFEFTQFEDSIINLYNWYERRK